MKKIKLSLFYKILIMFIVLIMPLYLLSFLLTVKMRNEINEEMEVSSFAKAQVFLKTIENDLSNCMKLQSRIINKSAIKRLGEKEINLDLERLRLILEVQEDIIQMYQGSLYVEEVIVYIESLNKSISNRIIQDISDAEYIQIVEMYAKNRKYPFIMVDDEFYCVLTPYSLMEKPKNYNPAVVFLFRVNRKLIEKELTEYFDLVNGGAFLASNATNAGIDLYNDQNASLYQEVQDYNIKQSDNSHTFFIKHNGQTLNLIRIESGVLNTNLYVYQPKDTMFVSLMAYKWYLLAVSFVLMISVCLFSVWVRHMVITPLNKLINAFSNLNESSTKIKVAYDKNDEFNYVYAQFNDVCAKLRHLIKQVYEEKLHSNNAELKQLQYQIAPHFLYNCLFIINRLARMENMEAVVTFSQHLGNYYQFITRSGDQEIALSLEFGHLKEYISIQSMRFGKRISVQQDKELDIFDTVLVPRLILQPLVENAYNHGLKNKKSNGIIRIRNEHANNSIRIQIDDNGEELTDQILFEMNEKLKMARKINETTGLLNIHRRLQIHFGEEYGIQMQRSELGGMCIILIIPDYNIAKSSEGELS